MWINFRSTRENLPKIHISFAHWRLFWCWQSLPKILKSLLMNRRQWGRAREILLTERSFLTLNDKVSMRYHLHLEYSYSQDSHTHLHTTSLAGCANQFNDYIHFLSLPYLFRYRSSHKSIDDVTDKLRICSKGWTNMLRHGKRTNNRTTEQPIKAKPMAATQPIELVQQIDKIIVSNVLTFKGINRQSRSEKLWIVNLRMNYSAYWTAAEALSADDNLVTEREKKICHFNY